MTEREKLSMNSQFHSGPSGMILYAWVGARFKNIRLLKSTCTFPTIHFESHLTSHSPIRRTFVVRWGMLTDSPPPPPPPSPHTHTQTHKHTHTHCLRPCHWELNDIKCQIKHIFFRVSKFPIATKDLYVPSAICFLIHANWKQWQSTSPGLAQPRSKA